jgi:hypothetical protein
MEHTTTLSAPGGRVWRRTNPGRARRRVASRGGWCRLMPHFSNPPEARCGRIRVNANDNQIQLGGSHEPG